jgi:hypothetical protein
MFPRVVQCHTHVKDNRVRIQDPARGLGKSTLRLGQFAVRMDENLGFRTAFD